MLATITMNNLVIRKIGVDMVGFNENFIRKCLEHGISERNLMITLDRARGVTLRAIADDEGVTPQRIRQIEANVLRKMKNLKGN